MEGQGIFDVIVDSAVMLDKAGRVLDWNTGAVTLFGYSKREVVGRSINLIYDRNYPFPKLIQELQASQKRWQEDTVFIRKNGIKGNCKTYLVPLPHNEQSKAFAILIHQNTAAIKKAEDEKNATRDKLLASLQQANAGFWTATALLLEQRHLLEQTERKLRESEIRFRLLAQNATDIISRHTPDGMCLYASPASKTLTGYDAEELVSKSLYKLIHRDDHIKLKRAFTRRRDDNNKPIVYRIKRKEGEYRWFESNVRLVIDSQTRIISEVQLASRDVTSRILDKKARLRGQQLAHVFRLSTMEEMASGMAHEISQPLAAIVNYTRGCVRLIVSNRDGGGR